MNIFLCTPWYIYMVKCIVFMLWSSNNCPNTNLTGLEAGISSLEFSFELSTLRLEVWDFLGDPIQLFLAVLLLPLRNFHLFLYYWTKRILLKFARFIKYWKQFCNLSVCRQMIINTSQLIIYPIDSRSKYNKVIQLNWNLLSILPLSH